MLYIVGFWHSLGGSGCFDWCYSPAAIMLSFCALGLFCFLSGFLISKKNATGFDNLTAVGRFYQRRLVRIYPLYAIAATAFFYEGLIPKHDFIAGLLLKGAVCNINILTLWFVNVIVIFYLVTPLMLFRFNPKRNLYGSIAAYFVLYYLSKSKRIDPRLAHYFIVYASGVLLARSPRAQEWVTKHGLKLLPLFLAAGWLATHKQAVSGKMWRFFLTDIAVLASMPALFILGQYLTRFVNEQLVSFVSYSAFALYLFHRIIFLAFPSLPTLPAFQFLYTMGVLLPVSIVICYFIQLAFDKLLGRSHVKLKTTTAIESAT